jgi:dihydroxyacetone kinase
MLQSDEDRLVVTSLLKAVEASATPMDTLMWAEVIDKMYKEIVVVRSGGGSSHCAGFGPGVLSTLCCSGYQA